MNISYLYSIQKRMLLRLRKNIKIEKIYNNKTCGKLSKSIIEKIIKNELNLELNDLTDGLSKINEHGIKLSTTGKAIGLDFKAVIIFGLYNIRASRYNNIEFNKNRQHE